MLPSIKIENLSKQYRLGLTGTGTLSHDINRWWHLVRGKEDPYLKIGDVNDRTTLGKSDYVWALRDINFEVRQGEILGVIGKNGAGKSTLLKILSKVTAPTTGSINYKGRIGSLLEVGTGFHQEQTGRENIFLNGAILGMQKKEICQKFDEIVDFSGCERYIDTPVKRYSSGMMVRLGFAVAAFLEPEILVVDEVLAVGDAEFQKKAIGKMQDVSSKDGRTVLFVSHNMSNIKELCEKCLLLEHGTVKLIGDTNNIIKLYMDNPLKIRSGTDLVNDVKVRRGHGEARFKDIVINDGQLYINPRDEIKIDLEVSVLQNISTISGYLEIRGNMYAQSITHTGFFSIIDHSLHVGETICFSIVIPPNTLRTGLFPLYLWLGKPKKLIEDNYAYDVIDSVYYLNISTDESEKILGYDPLEPYGFFNIKYKISNLTIKTTEHNT